MGPILFIMATPMLGIGLIYGDLLDFEFRHFNLGWIRVFFLGSRMNLSELVWGESFGLVLGWKEFWEEFVD